MVATGGDIERALLVGVQLKEHRGGWLLEDSLSELAGLAATCGVAVAGQTWQRVDRFNPATLVGSGKVEEMIELCRDLECQMVIFDDELTPGQLRTLEKRLGDGIRVLDRTALILDIFAQHARTREGKLQVELAQYQYRLPRLTRAWTHLARQAGGGGARGGSGGVGVRGPGETQLEVDRREIGRRIAQLRAELELVRQQRRLHREQRRLDSAAVVAIVGYTNAGKSTLLNAISGAGVLAEDKLFATLDPTTRRVGLPSGREVLFTDTVGFIQKLPTQLVAAFRATLEEIAEADLILHVIDASHPNAVQQNASVLQTLADLEVADRPLLPALNKADRLADPRDIATELADLTNAVLISASDGSGLHDLLTRIERLLAADLLHIRVRLPYTRGDLAAIFHEKGTVTRQEHGAEGTLVEGFLPRRWLEAFRPYL